MHIIYIYILYIVHICFEIFHLLILIHFNVCLQITSFSNEIISIRVNVKKNQIINKSNTMIFLFNSFKVSWIT